LPVAIGSDFVWLHPSPSLSGFHLVQLISIFNVTPKFLHWCSIVHEGGVGFISGENSVFVVSAETACCASNTAFRSLEPTHRGALEDAVRVLAAAALVVALSTVATFFPFSKLGGRGG
jgi:hypothetical protein